MSAEATIQGWIDNLNTVGQVVAPVLQEYAPIVQQGVANSFRSGVDANGQPWPKTALGAYPTVGAASRVTCTASGNSLSLSMGGYAPERNMMPATLPAKYADAIRDRIVTAAAEWLTK